MLQNDTQISLNFMDLMQFAWSVLFFIDLLILFSLQKNIEKETKNWIYAFLWIKN